MEVLKSSITEDSAKIERLLSQTEQLRKGVEVTSIGPQAQNQLRELLNIQDDALNAVLQERILKSLEFEGMYRRYDAVEEAHLKTFRWILDEPPQDHTIEGDDSDAKESSRVRFTDWLLNGKGIFHISGKLGAGKSTLMKYLGDSSQTKTKLEEWAGTYPRFF